MLNLFGYEHYAWIRTEVILHSRCDMLQFEFQARFKLTCPTYRYFFALLGLVVLFAFATRYWQVEPRR